MPLFATLQAVHEYTRNRQNAYSANNQKLFLRLADVFTRTWDLGLVGFGGPPVHFQILHQRFVDGHRGKVPWVDEQTYQELFALTQALPGPASTKMLFCMAFIHAGLLPAILAFLLWSLPGAICMFCLSLGVQQMNDVLPNAVYALLSGLNASTVGIVALAAVQLAEKAIKDRVSRILVIFGACAGLCYNALWYFPTLILAGGIVTATWDVRLRQLVIRTRRRWNHRRRARAGAEGAAENPSSANQGNVVNLASSQTRDDQAGLQRRNITPLPVVEPPMTSNESDDVQTGSEVNIVAPPTDVKSHGISASRGCIVVCCFFVSFIVIMVLKGTLVDSPHALEVFTNMYLAGTIIFGGGPVVIPLLREYVVEPGWVASRDFLIGLAIIQALPGPNFNFAVYLSSLAFLGTNSSAVAGGILGFIGIFIPGLILAAGFQGFWAVLRTKPAIIALLRGINATAVGLVFTAVYRLWQIGYLTPQESQGQSLAGEPWWVVVAVVTYAESAWFHVPPAPAIVLGAILGLVWYGVTGG